MADIAAAYNNRKRPNRGVSAKEECDEFRRKFADVMAKVNSFLVQTNSEIQSLFDPDEICRVMKDGYLEALGSMCSTLDFSNNIQMLSRVTKKLKVKHNELQEAENVNIFDRIEKMSYDFILRLRQHEMENTHVTE